jgi:hypothetical protein
MGKIIKLKDAVGTPNQENGIFNDYKWFLWFARLLGKIRIGQVDIPTHKEKGKWVVDESDVIRAIESFKEENMKNEKNSKEIENAPMPPSFSGYLNNSNFRLESKSYEIARKRSFGTWFCNNCNIPAKEEHNNPECHVCSDWNGCGKDCTLSRVYCSNCGKSMDVNIR